MCTVDARLTHVLAKGIQLLVHSAPSVFPTLQESANDKSQLRSKQTSKGPSPENSLTIGGCFEHYTYHIMVLGWLKKKKRKKKMNTEF